jgi:two-component system, NarL family, sensor histidine kinase UhpB
MATVADSPNMAATNPVRRVLVRLLRFPLFYKLLIANSLLVTLGAFAGTAITLRFQNHYETGGAWLAGAFTIVGVALTITLNTLLLHTAMRPLRDLQGTVDALGGGDFAARVPASPLADQSLASISETLNEMLDHVQRYQGRVEDLSASVIRAQEDERARIARELHDQIGQALTLLLVRLKIIEAQPNAEAVRDELRDLRAAVADTIDQVRRLALALRPPALDQLGLIPALRTLARDFADQTRTNVVADLPEGPLAMDIERATALYRVVQECLTNVAKHAEATNVTITLRVFGSMLMLDVADDGQGFDVVAVRAQERRKDGPGLGLFGMEERVRLLGGTYAISSTPAGGTTIHVIIPRNPLEAPHGPTHSDLTPIAADAHLVG